MKTSFLCVVPMAMILGGCVVTPRPMAVAQPSAPAGMGFEDQYSPPLEYVEGGAPVFYDAEPGVAYYPILLDTPGSCFCIVPMRYVNGVWLGVGGVVLYRGYFRFHYPTQHHRDVWVRSGGVVNGYAPMRGSVERVGNVLRPVPPPGSIHAQQLERQRAPREPGGQPQQVPYRQQPMQPQQAPNWQQANQPQQVPNRQQAVQPQQPPTWQQANETLQAPDRAQPMQPQQAPNRQQAMQPQQPPNWQQANQPQHAPDRPQPMQPQQAPNRQPTMPPQHAHDRPQPIQPQPVPNRPQPVQPQPVPHQQQANQPQRTPDRPQADQAQKKKRQDEKGTQ